MKIAERLGLLNRIIEIKTVTMEKLIRLLQISNFETLDRIDRRLSLDYLLKHDQGRAADL